MIIATAARRATVLCRIKRLNISLINPFLSRKSKRTMVAMRKTMLMAKSAIKIILIKEKITMDIRITPKGLSSSRFMFLPPK